MNKTEKFSEYPTAYHSLDPMAQELAKIAGHFEESSKKWQKIVYPAMFAFIILAIYGFFLIYSLTSDVRKISESMHLMTYSFNKDDGHMASIVSSMGALESDIKGMNGSVSSITGNISKLNNTIVTMNDSMSGIGTNMQTMSQQLAAIDPILQSIQSMDITAQDMANSTRHLNQGMRSIDRRMSPSGFMSKIMPF